MRTTVGRRRLAATARLDAVGAVPERALPLGSRATQAHQRPQLDADEAYPRAAISILDSGVPPSHAVLISRPAYAKGYGSMGDRAV